MDKKAFFNAMAAGWDERFYTEELRNRLTGLVRLFSVRAGMHVLDVGCGTGGIIPYLLEAVGPGGKIDAIDYAEEMIRLAQQKFRTEKRVQLHAVSVEELPFENKTFDHVVCFGVFPHLDDRPKALREIYRVLKDDGNVIIAHALSSEEIKSHHAKAEPVQHDHLPEETEMRRLLNTAGFSVVRIIDRPGVYLCDAVRVASQA